jgi:predicted HNH restriction endonuclease
VHHKLPVRERPDLRLVADNCVPLCGKCHQTVHREG